MGFLALEIIIVIILIIANGIFAMSEMALVSSRKSRLQQLAAEGSASAQAALDLANHPDRFLSTVQIGITTIGIIAGAFGGATLSGQIATFIGENVPSLAPYATAIGFTIVVAAITYLSLIVGELVPKRIALTMPESISAFMAKPMSILSRVASPLVAVLSFSTAIVFKLFKIDRPIDQPVSEEELKLLIEHGTTAGIFEATEKELVERVFRLGDRRAVSLMTPRPDLFWLDINDTEEQILMEIAGSKYSRFPVCDGQIDNVVGILKAKEYLAGKLLRPDSTISNYLTTPLYVPETSSAFHLLGILKKENTHVAFIIDEFGAIEGMVTSNDFLDALAGEPTLSETDEALILERTDGSLLVDGSLPIDEFVTRTGYRSPDGGRGDYQTVAGLLLRLFGQIPSCGDTILSGGFLFEVVDMDRRRIDKILVVDRRSAEADI